jgi:hypothetical protein
MVGSVEGMSASSRRRRVRAVLGGITLLLIPTLFALFPGWGTDWTLLPKLFILAAWLLAAFFGVLANVRQGEQLSGLAEGQRARELHSRSVALKKLTRAALLPEVTGLPAEYKVQVFLPNAERTKLLAAYDPDHVGPEEGWQIDRDPPQGVTGTAWKINSYVFAPGEKVSDATYGLTPEQQERYRSLTAVAATPIQNARNEPIGALTMFTTMEDAHIDDDFVNRHIGAAEIVARVLIDVGAVAHD